MSRRPGTTGTTALLVTACAGVLLLLGAGLSLGTTPEGSHVERSSTSRSASTPTPTRGPGGDPGSAGGELLDVAGAGALRPVAVRVASLGIASRLDHLQVRADGTLEPPPRWQVAGWYDGGPRPGEVGPAVIAGHVDSPAGPAVFTRLSELAPGDLIEVDDAAGDTTRFRVDRLDTAPQDSFPTEAVYGQTPDAQLRLITCSGAYDSDRGSYQDNLIVFATQVGQ